MNNPKVNSVWIMLYKNRLSFIDKSLEEFLVELEYEFLLKDIRDNKKTSDIINKINMCKKIVRKISGQAIELEKLLKFEVKGFHSELEVNENNFINELSIQDELSEKIQVLKDEYIKNKKVGNYEKGNLFIVIENELNKKINCTEELLKNSSNKIEEIKNQRYFIQRKLSEATNKYEDLLLNNEEKMEKLRLFKDIIRSNYIKEYNKTVKLINKKDTINKDIKTYYEYLYLITCEMEKLEGELYG